MLRKSISTLLSLLHLTALARVQSYFKFGIAALLVLANTDQAYAFHNGQIISMSLTNATCSKPSAAALVAGDTVTVTYDIQFDATNGFDNDHIARLYVGATGTTFINGNSIFALANNGTVKTVTTVFFIDAGDATSITSENLYLFTYTTDFNSNFGDFTAAVSCASISSAEIGQTVSNFMSRRTDQITASDPDLVDRLNRNENAGGGPGFSFSGSSFGGSTNLAFSTSLSQIANAQRAQPADGKHNGDGRMGLGAGGGGTGSTGFDLWVKGTFAEIDADTADHSLGLVYIGADYRVSSDLLVGLLAQVDWADESDSALNTDVDGFGWLAGPYMVARLSSNLYFDGRVAAGTSDNDITVTGVSTGSFDTTRWLARGRLTGDYSLNGWRFEPHVGVIYFEDRQDAFTDSVGNVIASQTVSLGRLTFGPKVSTTVHQADGTVIQPHLALHAIWDFDDADTVNTATGLATGTDDFRARVEAGLSTQMVNGWSVKGEAFYDGIGASDYDAYGGSVRVNVPLH